MNRPQLFKANGAPLVGAQPEQVEFGFNVSHEGIVFVITVDGKTHNIQMGPESAQDMGLKAISAGALYPVMVQIAQQQRPPQTP